MKNKNYKFISCLLALALIMTVLTPTVALATHYDPVNSANKDVSEDFEVSITMEDAEDFQVEKTRNQIESLMEESESSDKEYLSESKVEESGLGTPEDPKVTTRTAVTEDEESKETTTSVSKEKEWKDEKVEGNEESQSIETIDENGNLISASGQAQGQETTTIKDEKDTEVKVEEEIGIENNQGETADGKKIKTEEPEVTVELKPGEEKEETVNTNDPSKGNHMSRIQGDQFGFAQELTKAVDDAYQPNFSG